MVFWRGKGLLALLVVPIAAFITFGFLGGVLQLSPYANANHRGGETAQIGATIMILSAIFNYLTTIAPVLKDKPDEIVTREDGSRVKYDHTGSFMFIPRKFWTLIYGVIGIGLLVVAFTS